MYFVRETPSGVPVKLSAAVVQDAYRGSITLTLNKYLPDTYHKQVQGPQGTRQPYSVLEINAVETRSGGPPRGRTLPYLLFTFERCTITKDRMLGIRYYYIDVCSYPCLSPAH